MYKRQVGHWSDPVVQEKIASWQRVAVGVVESSHIRVIYANTKVREDIGCAALQRGPVVYAFEGVDNDDDRCV